jgi:hypothetical protein
MFDDLLHKCVMKIYVVFNSIIKGIINVHVVYSYRPLFYNKHLFIYLIFRTVIVQVRKYRS